MPHDREAEWEQTYVKPLGNIVTVTSELGEPIHKVGNVSLDPLFYTRLFPVKTNKG